MKEFEISEVDATGEIAKIYAEIRAELRVPVVNQIYRRLAAAPGGLEWAWPFVQAVTRSGDLERAARRLIEAVPFDEVSPSMVDEFRDLGVDSDMKAEVCTVLDAYNRSNPMNLIAVKLLDNALLAGQSAPILGARPEPVSDIPTPTLPPLVDIDVGGPDLRDIFLRLARQASGEDATIIPTLFRHLGGWPDFLKAAADGIDTLVERDALASITKGLDAAATTWAHRLRIETNNETGAVPVPVGHSVHSIHELLESFTFAISGMIVIGAWLRRQIPD